MGYLKPTAIIVGGSYDGWAGRARTEAARIFGDAGLGYLVSPLINGAVNSEQSFLVAWDGSKEGWDISNVADDARAEFVGWLRAQAYDDGSSPIAWVEVQYGGDDREAFALAHNGDGERPDAVGATPLSGGETT